MRILFLCVDNSARSQMAEGLARAMLPASVEVASAGLEPGRLNSMAVEALSERGIDISRHDPKSIVNVSTETADLVVVLCSQDVCPFLSGLVKRLHWPIADPAALGDIAAFRSARDQIKGRIEVLAQLLNLPDGLAGTEFHASIRVRDLAASARFYSWLLNTWPKEWTHRYATFIRPDLGLNFVLVVADGKNLHHDTLYHLGVALPDKAAVIDAYHRVASFWGACRKAPTDDVEGHASARAVADRSGRYADRDLCPAD